MKIEGTGILAVFFAGLVTITGCAYFSAAESVLKDRVAAYCTTPEMDRAFMRTKINEAIAPNAIEIHCAESEAPAAEPEAPVSP